MRLHEHQMALIASGCAPPSRRLRCDTNINLLIGFSPVTYGAHFDFPRNWLLQLTGTAATHTHTMASTRLVVVVAAAGAHLG